MGGGRGASEKIARSEVTKGLRAKSVVVPQDGLLTAIYFTGV